MGYGIYRKSSVNKEGKTPLFWKVTSGRDKVIKRNLGISIKPSEWDSKRFLIHSKAENAHIYNERINEVNNKLRKAWSLYESETYSWDEMVAFLSGAKTTLDVKSFCETVIKPNQTDNVYKGVKDAYGAVKKVLGRELVFDDLSYNTVDLCVKNWKERLRSATLKTYKYHFGIIINEAYKKKLTLYKYEPIKKWSKKKDKVNRKTGRPTVSTATHKQFLNSLDKAKDLWDIEALGFWLLMFGMRGLYPTDLCNIHKYKWDFYLDPPKAVLFHLRNKSEEPMDISYSYPFDDLTQKLRGYLQFTHGWQTNKKTGKRYTRSKEYKLSDNEKDGWFFNKYRKDDWGIFTKKLNKLGMEDIKAARATFGTIASTLTIPQAVWYALTGHEIQGIKQAYTNKQWKDLTKQVDTAHNEVLDKFSVDKIYPKLIVKANEILAAKGVNVEVFNETYKC